MARARASLRFLRGPAAVLIASLGCRLVSALPATPTPSPAPTATSAPLYQQVTLTSRSATQTGQPFGYTITMETPLLTGSDDPRVLAFNAEMASIVTTAAAGFKADLANVPPTPVSEASTYDVRY